MAALAGSLAAAVSVIGLSNWLDLRLLDLVLRNLPSRSADRPVVLIAIDEPSLQSIGQWPWSRRHFADLLDSLGARSPAMVAFDILFAEADKDAGADDALAASMTGLGRVVLSMAGTFHGPNTPALEVLPHTPLLDAAAGLGHTNVEADSDGRVRRLQQRAGVGVPYWPSLVSAALAVADGRKLDPAPAGARDDQDLRGWATADEVLLPLLPMLNEVRRFSFIELIPVAPSSLPPDAIVVVGVTAAGLGPDFRVSEGMGSRTIRGSELHAAAAAAHTRGVVVVPLRPGPSLLLSIVVGAGLGLMVGMATRSLLVSTSAATLAAISLSALPVTIAGMWWAPGPAILGATAMLVLEANQRWLSERLAVRESRLRADLALRSIADAVLATDAHLRIVSANPATRSILGVEPERLVGRTLREALRLPAGDGVAALLARFGADRTPLDLTIDQPAGPPREVRASVARLATGRSSGAGFVVILSDVTADRQLAREAMHRATHDALTGLPNRVLLDDRIDGSLARARRAGKVVAIAFVDVDRFKSINDGCGHGGGDAVLCELGRRLRHAIRECDAVGRIGGDEFVLTLEGLSDEADALPPLERLTAVLAPPVEIVGHSVHLTTSIGVSLFPRDGAGREELVRCADLAMYRAKQTGRDRIVFYAEDMNTAARNRLWLEREFRAALEVGALSIHYQPRFALDRLRLAGFECLARWQHAERGAIPPSLFIPLAEETGLICPLGRTIVTQAAAALGEWRHRQSELMLSINLSVVQLKADDGFVAFVADALQRHQLQPRQLEFEITESLFLDPALATVDRRLRELVGLGVRLAIDDFGTGYSSLGYLRRLPFNAIKIDRSFVRDVAIDSGGRAITEAIVALGRSLDKRLVAEGVETDAQLQLIKELGCDEAQGYLLGRPQPAEEASRLLLAA